MWTEYVEPYLDHIKTNTSPKNYLFKEVSLKKFYTFFSEKNFKEISEKDLSESFFNYLKGYLNSTTIFFTFLHVKEWFSFLENQLNIRVPDISKVYTRAYTEYKELRKNTSKPVSSEDDLRVILKELNRPNDSDNLSKTRNKLIILFLHETGLRVSEIINLRKENVDLPAQVVNLNSKRKLKISNETSSLLRTYLESRKDNLPYLFTSISHSAKGNGKPLTPRTIQRVRESVGKKVQFDKKITPKAFRNSKVEKANELLRELGLSEKE